MRTSIFLLATLGLIEGCSGTPGTDGTTDGANIDTAPVENGTIIGQTTIGGESVACQICVEGEDGTEVEKSTGVPIQVPANVTLNIMAGNEAVGTDCEETPRPLHAHTDGTVWTYEKISEVVQANETLSVKIPLNRFIIGWYRFTVETTWYNEDTGEFDGLRETETLDELMFLRTMGGKWIEVPEAGDEIAHIGNGGRYYTLDAEFAFEPDEGLDDYIEDSWIERDTFWFRLVQSEYKISEVSGTLVREAENCDE